MAANGRLRLRPNLSTNKTAVGPPRATHLIRGNEMQLKEILQKFAHTKLKSNIGIALFRTVLNAIVGGDVFTDDQVTRAFTRLQQLEKERVGMPGDPIDLNSFLADPEILKIRQEAEDSQRVVSICSRCKRTRQTLFGMCEPCFEAVSKVK